MRVEGDHRGDSGPSAATPTPAPAKGDDAAARPPVCPELPTVSASEFKALFESVSAVAHRRVRSPGLADDLVQETFSSLLTTRRWDPSRRPLAAHLIQSLKSLIHHAYESKASAREQRAVEEYQREVLGEEAASPENVAVERAESEERQAEASRELTELEKRVSGHAVATGVLRCRSEGLDKPADIARALNVPVQQVYRATDTLRHHLKAIREPEKT